MSLNGTRVHVRRRHISLRVYENRYDDNNNKLCLNCGNPVIGRRADAKYCSNDCSWNFYVKNNWRLLRIKILRRDGFTCQLCGDNRGRVKVNGKVKRNFNVDHKIPIFKGGKEFDESNLWTLCIMCHRAKTRIELGQHKTTASHVLSTPIK